MGCVVCGTTAPSSLSNCQLGPNTGMGAKNVRPQAIGVTYNAHGSINLQVFISLILGHSSFHLSSMHHVDHPHTTFPVGAAILQQTEAH